MNWTRATSMPARADPPGQPVTLEIESMSIRNFAFEYEDRRSGAHHFFAVDELAAIGKWSQPLKLTLSGRVNKSFPYSIHIEGGSAQLLQEAREAWPFALDFEFLGTRLHASGTVDAGGSAGRFDFGAGTDDLKQIESFLQTSLPRPRGRRALRENDRWP